MVLIFGRDTFEVRKVNARIFVRNENPVAKYICVDEACVLGVYCIFETRIFAFSPNLTIALCSLSPIFSGKLRVNPKPVK